MLQVTIPEFSLDTNGKLPQFLVSASRADQRALLLDYDGTLAAFRPNPDDAVTYPGVRPLLRAIRSAADTRIVIVTGRRAGDAAGLLGVEGIEIWGCHGFERLREDGSHETHHLREVVERALSAARGLVAPLQLSEFAEYKPTGIAFHWRGREVFADGVTKSVRALWSELPDRKSLCLLPFDGGVEIRAACVNKGDAVRTVLCEMDDDAAIAYVGDDLTDEDAFAALKGHGLGVRVRQSARHTLADVSILPGEEVIAFLAAWALVCGGVS